MIDVAKEVWIPALIQRIATGSETAVGRTTYKARPQQQVLCGIGIVMIAKPCREKLDGDILPLHLGLRHPLPPLYYRSLLYFLHIILYHYRAS
jgi:hypothetical protein